jgi:hypothetical protein
MIQKYMSDRNMEIIAVLEGVDSATGGIVQARHSYLPHEIEWNKTFTNCVSEDKRDGSAVIDLNSFHETVDVSLDAPFCEGVASFT